MAHVTKLTYAIWVYLSGGWTDITADVISGSVSGVDGMTSNKSTDRVAATGQFSFMLKNLTGKYSPGHASALSGWRTNIPAKLVFLFRSTHYPVYGRIAAAPDGIQIDSASKGMPTVRVVVVDWFDRASKDPIVNPGILTDKRGNQVITTALGLTPIPPLATDLDTGVCTFPTVFDTVTSKTKAYDELVKVALSEMGYVYLKHDTTHGETLVFDNNQARSGLRTETQYNTVSETSEITYGLREDGGFDLREDGGYEEREQATPLTTTFDGDNTFLPKSDSISHGANIINRLSIYANPRKVDASAVVLFRLSHPILIGAGQTYELKGSYADPSGGLPVNGQNMITPVATTDYLMNTAQDGSGTNITANLSVSASYGTEGFTHQLTNTSTSAGWVTQFNCRGYGIYNYNPIEHTAKDQTSINANGTFGESINQKYQKTLDYGKLFADAICYAEKDPETRIDRVYFIANYSPAMMDAFLQLGTGDMIRLKSTQANIDAYYFIQGREYQILKGNLIMFSWVVKEFLSLALGLSLVGAQFAGSTGTDMVNFGSVPWLQNLTQQSISVWVYPTAAEYGTIGGVIDGNDIGDRIDMNSNRTITYIKAIEPAGMPGSVQSNGWTTNLTLTLNAWNHILVTHDRTASPATDPVIRINGVTATLTNPLPVAGTAISQGGQPLQIGNMKTPSIDYANGFNGKIANLRYYNDIVSVAEGNTLYAAGVADTGTLTDHLVFQTFTVRTKDLAYFTNHTLLSTDRLIDNIYGIVGTPHGTPITRLLP